MGGRTSTPETGVVAVTPAHADHPPEGGGAVAGRQAPDAAAPQAAEVCGPGRSVLPMGPSLQRLLRPLQRQAAPAAAPVLGPQHPRLSHPPAVELDVVQQGAPAWGAEPNEAALA